MINTQLSPELEENARILDAYTRERFQAVQDRMDRRAIANRMDGDYNFARLLCGLREYDVARLAPYESACSDAIARACGRQPHHGYAFVPVDMQQVSLMRRDLTSGIGGAGGYLVSTDVAPGNIFVGFLHANSVLIRQNVSRLALVGNAGFPKISGTISNYWLPTEGVGLTESQMNFAIAAGTPKSLGSYCEMSDLLLKQTSAAAQFFVLREMARATAAELDKKLLSGSGASGEPTGLLNVNGVGSVAGTSLAYGGILDVIKNVENASALVQPAHAGFVLAPDVARLLRAREKAVGSGMIMNGNTLADFPAQVTKSIPDGSMVFGDWSQMVLCEWGLLEVGVDPYGSDGGLFKKGFVGIRTIWTIDPVVLHPESFNKVVSIT